MNHWFDTPFEHPWLPAVADYLQRLSECADPLCMGATGWRRQCPAGPRCRCTRSPAAVALARGLCEVQAYGHIH